MYKKHVFVCENIRDSSGRKSCGKIGTSIRMNLKREIVSRKLNKEIRINRSGCLGKCSQGPCLVIYPQGDWHFNTKVEECEKIIDQLVSE
tara:strand:+ start:602 stop:871 length:270 start_codon:yes stop_codon:yes gene_type:complete